MQKLYNKTLGHIKSLEDLEQNPNTWGSLLLHLITSKMDYNTIQHREVESPRSEKSSFKDLLDFYKARFKMLEAIELLSNLSDKFRKIKKFFNVKKSTMKLTFLATSVELQCYFCKQNIIMYRCQAFNKLSFLTE